MAWKLKYRCKDCGYEAEVYEGRGLFRQQITAVSCPDCKGGVRDVDNIVEGTRFRTSSWAASLPMLRPPIGVRLDVCACNAAVTRYASGT